MNGECFVVTGAALGRANADALMLFDVNWEIGKLITDAGRSEVSLPGAEKTFGASNQVKRFFADLRRALYRTRLDAESHESSGEQA